MKRLIPTGFTGVIAAAALAVAITASAIAYFTAEGTGTAAAAVSKLTAPTTFTVTPAVGGTVALSWSAVTAPGSGTVQYFVSRDGGDPAGTCAAPAVPAAATSCVDKDVPIGTHTYTVTAVWRSWSVTSAVKSATITIGTPTHFTIAGSTTTPAVNGAVNLTITAKDENEKTVTTYTGSHSLIFSGAASSPGGNAPTVVSSAGTVTAFGKTTALSFSAGVAAVSSSKNGLMRIYKSGPAEIVATEGALSTPVPLEVTVSPGTQTKFTMAAATTTPVAGAANDLTIAAVDTYGNIAPTYTGSHQLIFSGAVASPAPSSLAPTVSDELGNEVPFGTLTPILFEAGVASADGVANGEMKIYKSGAATTIRATEDGGLTNTTALSVTVAPGPAIRFLLATSNAAPAAAASANLTTTAKDVYENTVTTYTGAKSLTFSGATASPGGTPPTVVNSAGTQIPFGTATAINFTAGVAAVSSSRNGLLRLYRSGPTSITVSDGAISNPAPLAVTVVPLVASKLGLTSVAASAGTVASTCLFTCPVTGLGNSGTVSANVSITDTYGNTVSDIGTGHQVKVVTTGGTIAGTPLAIAATGPAVSETRFTYTSPASGSFSNTITVSKSAGTTYTSTTATASK